MFYIIVGGHIVDAQSKEPSQETLQQWADSIGDSAYVIEGEHAGLSAEPTSPQAERD